MSEIASKANAGNSSSTAQPLAKKGSHTTHEMLFAALFGGVVAAETEPDSKVSDITPVNTDTDSGAESDGNSNIMAAMHAVVAMRSVESGTDLKDELSAEPDEPTIGDRLIIEGDDIVGANPMMIGPTSSQQQSGRALPSAKTSAVIAEMAYEDEVVTPQQQKDGIKLIPSRAALNLSGVQIQTAALSSSSSLKLMKSAEKSIAHSDLIDDMPISELEIETRHLRSDGQPNRRLVIKPATYQQNMGQTSLAKSNAANGSDLELVNMDGDIQFDSPANSMRTGAAQTERATGGISDRLVFGESLSTNAVRQMQTGGLSASAQILQQNNAQLGVQSIGQSGNLISAGASMTNSSMMEMLDMAQDNWTEMLLQRVERSLAGGKDKINFHLNPRNLGRMRISLVVQNERTNVLIQTETSVAAQLLNDAEARLAQMMDASGLKFGNLTSQYSQNFGGNFAGQNSRQGREDGLEHATGSETTDGTNNVDAEISVEQTENLINMQA